MCFFGWFRPVEQKEQFTFPNNTSVDMVSWVISYTENDDRPTTFHQGLTVGNMTCQVQTNTEHFSPIFSSEANNIFPKFSNAKPPPKSWWFSVQPSTWFWSQCYAVPTNDSWICAATANFTGGQYIWTVIKDLTRVIRFLIDECSSAVHLNVLSFHRLWQLSEVIDYLFPNIG